MRKIFKFITLILAFMMFFGVAACQGPGNTDDSKTPVHVHELSGWVSNGKSHWKECNGCDEVFEYGDCTASSIIQHDEDNHWKTCTICGGVMEKEPHIYNTKYEETCTICGTAREMVTVTYKDGEEVVNTLKIAKGTVADDFYVDYSTVTWMKNGQEYDMTTPVTEDITLTAGAKTEHDHEYIWKIGEGEDTGYDIGTCGECGKIEKLSTVLTPSELQYIDMAAASVAVSAPLPVGMTAVSLQFDGEEIATANEDGLVMNPSEVFEASDYGPQTLEVVGMGPDGAEHIFSLSVIAVTKFIEEVDDLAAVKFASKDAPILGYFALSGDIDADGATVTSDLYEWSGQYGFCGTFDGRGFTISNLTVTGCGIFGHLGNNAMIKNVHFDKIALGSGIWGTTGAPLFARVAANFSGIEDVTVNYTSIFTDDKITTPEYGLLVSRQMNVGEEKPTDPLLKNIILNAKGLVVPNAFGLAVNSRIKFENVVVIASEIKLLGASDANGEQPLEQINGVTTILPIEEDTFAAAEDGATTLMLQSDIFKVGETADILLNGIRKQVEVVNEGELTLTLADFSVITFGRLPVSVLLDESEYVFSDVWYVTKVITQFSDLSLLNNTNNARNTGYYILGDNLDGAGENIDGGSTTAWNQNQGFGGTFDGRGYTVSNFGVSGYGIFGGIGLGTIKNVNFSDVTLNSGSALFARTMYNSKVIDVTLSLKAFNSTSGECGLFVSRETNTSSGYSNIVVDANGCDIYNVLGCGFNASTIVDNFVINNAGEITLYGSSANDTSAPIAKPDGLTVNHKTVA